VDRRLYVVQLAGDRVIARLSSEKELPMTLPGRAERPPGHGAWKDTPTANRMAAAQQGAAEGERIYEQG
jgi:hypothetical protein